MHSAVTAKACVRLSVTLWCFVQMNEDTIMRSSVSGSTMGLVSEKVKFTRTFEGDNPLCCLRVRFAEVTENE